MLLCDFHIHSNWSDGELTIPQIIDLYGQHGFDVIALTDHLCENHNFLGRVAHRFNLTIYRENFEQYMEELKIEAERAWKQYEMLVLPGVEITKNSLRFHRSAHILVLGLQEFIDPTQDIIALLEQAKSQNAVTVAAHPVPTRKFEPQTLHLWSRRNELGELFDAWEVASGSIMFDEVLKSGMPMLANSDLHLRKHFSSWKTLLRCEKTADAALQAIRNQDLRFIYFQAEHFKRWTPEFLPQPSYNSQIFL
jgi:predicted metal-dependent phosphoesterase TrpH